MGFYDFPHTRNYDADLGYIIKWVKDNKKVIDSQTALVLLKAVESKESADIASAKAEIARVEAERAQNATTEAEGLVNTVKDTINQVAVNTQRIDTFTHLTEGTTTADAEIIDARIAYNGQTYDSLGTAIRTVTDTLNLDDEYIENALGEFLALPVANGGFTVTDGILTTNTTSGWKRVTFTPRSNCFYRIKVRQQGTFQYSYYIVGTDNNYNVIDEMGIKTAENSEQEFRCVFSSNVTHVYVRSRGTTEPEVLEVEHITDLVNSTARAVLEDDFKIDDVLSYGEYNYGSYNGQNGNYSNAENPLYVRSGAIKMGIGWKIRVPEGYSLNVCQYTNTDVNSFVSGTSYRDVRVYNVPAENYYRFAIRKNNGTTFATTDVSDIVKIVYGQHFAWETDREVRYVPVDFFDGIYNRVGYNNYGNIIAKWDELINRHPHNMKKSSVGLDSSGEYTIYAYEITSNAHKYKRKSENVEPKKIVYISCIHGSETTIPAEDLEMFRAILEDSTNNLDTLFGDIVFEIIPVLNPYGVDHNSRLNFNNVNLNRNFPSREWKYISAETNPQNYTGEAPADQIETRLAMDFITEHNPILVVNRHQSDNLTLGKNIIYARSNIMRDRNIAKMVLAQCQSMALKKMPYLTGKEYYTNNLFGVIPDSNNHGTMDEWCNDNGQSAYLIESAYSLGDDYPNPTQEMLEPFWRLILTSVIGLMLAMDINK